MYCFERESCVRHQLSANYPPSLFKCFISSLLLWNKTHTNPFGCTQQLVMYFELLILPHGSFLCILSTYNRSYVQELKIQTLPVYGSPAGRYGLQPGLFICLRQVDGFVYYVRTSLRKYAATRIHPSSFLLHHPRSTRSGFAMLEH